MLADLNRGISFEDSSINFKSSAVYPVEHSISGFLVFFENCTKLFKASALEKSNNTSQEILQSSGFAKIG